MKRLRALSLGVCLLSPVAAWAVAGVADSVTAVTVTGSSASCLVQNNYRKSLTLDATGATQNIGYCEGTCTAVIGNSGTTTLAFGSMHYWPAGSAPANAFSCISAGGSQPLTIREGQ